MDAGCVTGTPRVRDGSIVDKFVFTTSVAGVPIVSVELSEGIERCNSSPSNFGNAVRNFDTSLRPAAAAAAFCNQ